MIFLGASILKAQGDLFILGDMEEDTIFFIANSGRFTFFHNFGFLVRFLFLHFCSWISNLYLRDRQWTVHLGSGSATNRRRRSLHSSAFFFGVLFDFLSTIT